MRIQFLHLKAFFSPSLPSFFLSWLPSVCVVGKVACLDILYGLKCPLLLQTDCSLNAAGLIPCAIYSPLKRIQNSLPECFEAEDKGN